MSASDSHTAQARELFDELSTERDEWARNYRITKIASALRAAAAEEREACARIADETTLMMPDTDRMVSVKSASQLRADITRAIRARGSGR